MKRVLTSAILSLFLSLAMAKALAGLPQLYLPKSHLAPEDLAVIVNDDDPLSRQIAAYYQARRGIPRANMIHVRFDPRQSVMSRKDFSRIKGEVDARTPESIQAFALTWAAPYRVDCMSITSAFAFGFDSAYCASCKPTKPSPYFNSPSVAPYGDYKMRPTMALAGRDFAAVKALIDRGVGSDGTRPAGTGYLVSTHDKNRNVRAAGFPGLIDRARGWVRLRLVEQDYVEGRDDVLFYFTGLASVPKLDTLRFVPGAMADHLTSVGGQLTDSAQMSSLRWLEAGATGSYGAVVEPCNFTAKFPNPAVAVFWYTHGASLIEAYWKSVAWPGEGIFIGEPLAAPFSGFAVRAEGHTVVIDTQALVPGEYAMLGADSVIGPYHPALGPIRVTSGSNEIELTSPDKAVYRLVKVR